MLHSIRKISFLLWFLTWTFLLSYLCSRSSTGSCGLSSSLFFFFFFSIYFLFSSGQGGFISIWFTVMPVSYLNVSLSHTLLILLTCRLIILQHPQIKMIILGIKTFVPLYTLLTATLNNSPYHIFIMLAY